MLSEILVREWMTESVVTATPDLAISKAHQLMKEYGIRRLPVLDGEKLVGIITIGDVREASPSGATTLSIWELNYLWSQLKVKDVMTRQVKTIGADDPIIDAAQIMLDAKVSGLPVVNKDGRVIGILTESDIFRMLVKSQTETV